jgi:hypothetical protein
MIEDIRQRYFRMGFKFGFLVGITIGCITGIAAMAFVISFHA